MSPRHQNEENGLTALSDACEAAFARRANDECRRLASCLSHAAAMQGLRSFEARGLLRQGQCAQRDARFDTALEAAQRAALLYEMTGDVSGEIEALALAGHVAMLRHRHEDAIESALLAARLAEQLPASPLYVLAHTELGMVHAWSNNAAAADAAFARAIEAAHAIAQPQLAALPAVHRQLAAAIDRVQQHQPGHARAVSASPLAAPLRRRAAALPVPDAPLDPADACLRLGAEALTACGAGDRTRARRLAAACSAAALALGSNWLQALGAWAATESALLEQRLDDADAEARRMLALAAVDGHEPLAEMAQLLLSLVLQRKGQLGPSLAVLFALYERKAAQRGQALLGREQTVRWRLGMREQTRRVQELERLTHEDPLTALANRRAFDAALDASVWQWQTEARSFALLLIDVDRFKQINDRHSHVLGDEVLRRIGEVLAGAAGEGDLAARRGGDEFVLLLRNQGGRTAESCRQRIEQAMLAQDWSALAPGLDVSLSIGIARMAVGDDADRLLARADAAMYRHKARLSTVGRPRARPVFTEKAAASA